MTGTLKDVHREASRRVLSSLAFLGLWLQQTLACAHLTPRLLPLSLPATLPYTPAGAPARPSLGPRHHSEAGMWLINSETLA